jgi:Arabinose efflux permease
MTFIWRARSCEKYKLHGTETRTWYRMSGFAYPSIFPPVLQTRRLAIDLTERISDTSTTGNANLILVSSRFPRMPTQLNESCSMATADEKTISLIHVEGMPEYNYLAFQEMNEHEEFDDNEGINNDLNEEETFLEANNKVIPKDNDDNGKRSWTLFLYSITTVLLFSDQNLLAPNLSQAANEFGFDDNERDQKLGGDIALAFFVLGAPASFLLGCGADSDSVSRSFLFGLTVLIGEGACFCTYFTTTYTGLYVTRALTGFSVGGALPLLSSVLGDWYKPEERSAVMASVGIGTGIGIAMGQGIAGYLGPLYGWRLPFLCVSLPAIFVALLLMTTVVDPVRGRSENTRHIHSPVEEGDSDLTENHEDNARHGDLVTDSISDLKTVSSVTPLSPPAMDTKASDAVKREHFEIASRSFSEQQCFNTLCWHSLWKQFPFSQHLATTKELLSCKTVVLTLLQGAPGCIPWGIVNTFLNDYLSEDCGMSVQAATTTVLFFGMGNFFGMVIGGIGGDYLYKKNQRYPALLSGLMAIIGCFPLWVLINTTRIENGEISFGTGFKTMFISVLSGIGSGVTGPVVKATLQNVTIPHSRGQAFALLNTFDDFGRGLGPVFVAKLIQSLGNRQRAFNVGVGGWILCGLLNLCMFFTVGTDEARAKAMFLDRYSKNISQSSGVEDDGTQ